MHPPATALPAATNRFRLCHHHFSVLQFVALVNFKNDFELTGSEDPLVLTGYVTALAANDGYKEGMTAFVHDAIKTDVRC